MFFFRYAIREDGPLTSSAGLEAVGFISTKYANQSDDWPDMEFMLTSSSTPSDGGLQVNFTFSNSWILQTCESWKLNKSNHKNFQKSL